MHDSGGSHPRPRTPRILISALPGYGSHGYLIHTEGLRLRPPTAFTSSSVPRNYIQFAYFTQLLDPHFGELQPRGIDYWRPSPGILSLDLDYVSVFWFSGYYPLVMISILPSDTKNVSLYRGLANFTSFGRGTRHLELLNVCHIPGRAHLIATYSGISTVES